MVDGLGGQQQLVERLQRPAQASPRPRRTGRAPLHKGSPGCPTAGQLLPTGRPPAAGRARLPHRAAAGANRCVAARRRSRGDPIRPRPRRSSASGRQIAQRAALSHKITGLTPQLQRPLTGLDCALEPAHQHQLVGKAGMQPGRHSQVGIDGTPQHPLELRGRLPVRAQFSGLARRWLTIRRSIPRLGRSRPPPASRTTSRRCASPPSCRGGPPQRPRAQFGAHGTRRRPLP